MNIKEKLSEEQIKCIIAVQEINEELERKNDHRESNLLSITIASGYFFVTFNINTNFNIEIPLFNSEDDDRLFYEDQNEYKDWKTFFKRKLKESKQEIKYIKL